MAGLMYSFYCLTWMEFSRCVHAIRRVGRISEDALIKHLDLYGATVWDVQLYG